MNLKTIIGLGLLAFFTNCQTPTLVATTISPATYLNPAAVVELPRPLPVAICRPITPPSIQNVHIDIEGRIEKCINRWTENGELHQLVQKEDADHNIHKVHRFMRDGKPCEIDEWVDSRSGASVHSHRYVAEDECLHQVRIVTDVQGRTEQRQYRKDPQGSICQISIDGKPILPEQSILLSQPTSEVRPQFLTSQGANQPNSGNLSGGSQGVFPNNPVLDNRPTGGAVSPSVVCVSNLQRQ